MKKRSITLSLALILVFTACGHLDNKKEEAKKPQKPTEKIEAHVTELSEPAIVEAAWLMETDIEDYTMIENDDEGQPIVFSTDKDITDFKIHSLTYLSSDEEGNIAFNSEEMYSLDSLTVSSPLALNMLLSEAVPNFGISYVDTDGETKSFLVSTSGMDGSIMLIYYPNGFDKQ